MKRAYAGSQYAKLYEQYCRTYYPEEAERIFDRAEQNYLAFEQDMPDTEGCTGSRAEEMIR